MPEKWTGRLVGQMHNERITQEDLAVELGCSKGYINMILNGKRSPGGARERLTNAFAAIVARRQNDGE